MCADIATHSTAHDGRQSVARAVEPEELADGRAGNLFEALAIRLDGAGGLVEKDPFDAEERDEHRDEIEIRLLVAGDLMDPVLERIEIDAAHRHTGGGEGHQHPEELLLGIDEIDDDQRRRKESFDHCFSLSSIRTPLPAAGCRKAT